MTTTLTERPDPKTGEKPTNPKDILGTAKLPLHLWPATATAMGCVGMLEGALKYGRDNFRVTGARASVYVGALLRHISAWWEGEDRSEVDVPHLANQLACIAIIVDAMAAGKLTDDRKVKGGYGPLVEDLTKVCASLRERFKDKDPYHYSIKDNG